MQRRQPDASLLRAWAGYLVLSLHALSSIRLVVRDPYATAFLRQFNQVCRQGMRSFMVRALGIGVVLNAFVIHVIGANTYTAMTVLATTVVREGGPLFVALVLLLSVGPDNTTRLGTQWSNGEARQLAQTGIHPHDYLVVPRILGMAVATIILTFVFQILAVLGAVAGGMLLLDESLHQMTDALLDQVRLQDLVYTFIKSAVFGTVIATITCYHGIGSNRGAYEDRAIDLREAVSQSLVRSLFFITTFNALLAYLFYGVVLFGLYRTPV